MNEPYIRTNTKTYVLCAYGPKDLDRPCDRPRTGHKGAETDLQTRKNAMTHILDNYPKRRNSEKSHGEPHVKREDGNHEAPIPCDEEHQGYTEHADCFTDAFS